MRAFLCEDVEYPAWCYLSQLLLFLVAQVTRGNKDSAQTNHAPGLETGCFTGALWEQRGYLVKNSSPWSGGAPQDLG